MSGVSISSDTEIQPNESFDLNIARDESTEERIYIVIDENGDGTYDTGEAYTSITASTIAPSATFPAANTTGLDGTFQVYAAEAPDRSSIDISNTSPDTITIDGSPPYLTDVNARNPSARTLNVSFTSTELLNQTTIQIDDSDGNTVETFNTGGLTNQTTGKGELYYTSPFSVTDEDTYTVDITEATDTVGNDAADNQTSTLRDSVVVDTTPPGIDSIEAEVGSNTVDVTFNETVNASDGTPLEATNFTYNDGNGGGVVGVSSVDHTAGDSTATLTLDTTVTRTDIGNDTIGAANDEITDGFGNFVANTGTLADTQQPDAPTGVSGVNVTRSNDDAFAVDVALGSNHEAGTLSVTVSSDGGGSETFTRDVDSGGEETVTLSPLDVSSLADGQITLDATLTDAGGNTSPSATNTSITKDTDRPTVEDVTLTNATVNSLDNSDGYGTYDTGVTQTVTVNFSEPLDAAPDVALTGLTSTYDVTESSFSGDTWEGTFTLNDDNDNTTAAVNVSGATDLVGNTMSRDDSNTVEVVTTRPARPDSVSGGPITASNATNYNVTVGLLSDSEADEVVVRLSNGSDTVAKSNTSFTTPAPDSVVVTGIDASSLPEGDVTVEAKTLDNGSANPGGFDEVQATVHKDTERPSVSSVTVEDAPINDSEAGASKTVTVNFDQPVDTSVSPTVTLTNLSQGDTTVDSGSFDDATTWTGEVTIADNEETTVADIDVSDVEDAVGNGQTPTTYTTSFDIDTQTPGISKFDATHTGGGDIQVSIEANQTLADIAVSLDETTLTDSDFTASGTSYTATYTPAADGNYTATLEVAADDAGNGGATGQTADVTVDTTAPTFSSASPDGTTVATDQPEITLDVSDATRDVDASTIEVTVSDSEGVNIDNATTSATGISYSGTTLTVNTSDAGISLADGSVTVTVAANDTVDNRDQTSFSLDVDTTKPVFTNATPEGTTETDDTRTVSVDVADTGAGVDSSSLAVSISNGTDTVLSDAGTATNGVSFDGTTLTIDPAGSGVPALPNGTVTVDVSATDAVGNTNTTAFSFTLDTPPVISGFSAANTTSGDRNATVSFESSDDLATVDVAVSGAESASLSLANFTKTAVAGGFEYTATYEGSTDGTYDFTLQTASDGVTDAASGQTASALVDEAAPDVTISTPNGGGLYRGGETVTIEWTATDNVTVTDDVRLEYSTDDGSSWSTVASGLDDDGSYDWTIPGDDTTDALVRVSASDNSSNTGTDTSDATFEVDSTAPTVESFSVSNPSGQAVTVTIQTDEALATASDSVAVSVSGATTSTLSRSAFTETGSGPYTYEATFNDSTEGTYTATLEAAADAAGNDGAGTESDSVEVDTVTPTISNLAVENPTGQSVNVSFDASERLASTAVELETPTTTTTLSSLTETGSGPYTYYATYDEATDGQYNVTLTRADDGLGNDGADGQTDTVVVDTTPPTLSNVSVTNPTGRQVRVHFDASEPIDVVAVDITGAETATVQTDNPSVVDGSYVLTYTGNSDGDYTATVSKAVDASGNDASNPSGTVNVTTAKPVISGFAASNPEAQNVTVTFGSDEALADIAVSLSGAETATLTEANFTQSGDTYTATYEGSSNGTYTAVLETAADANGDDGASGQTNSVTVGSTEPAGPAISGFSLGNPSDRVLRVFFDADETLADVGVAITGADAATLTATDFQVSGDTYTANVTVDADGEYTATLFEATDSSGADGADGQSATATVDTTASESSGDDGSTDDDGSSSGGGSLSSSPGSPPAPAGPAVSVTTTSAESASVAVQDADAGSEVTIPLDNGTRAAVDVTALRVTTAESMDYSLSVSSSTDPAPGAPSFEGRALGHVEVTHSFDDADVTGATMTVGVAADRFTAAGVEPGDASLYRYHDGDWDRLDTAVAERTDERVVLEADTPGFSTFAVGVSDADAVRVSGASVTASATTPDEAVPVSVTVESDASWRTSVTLAVTANGSTAATQRVEVPAGGSTTVAVDVSFDVPGDYQLTVEGTSAGTLAVRAPDEGSGADSTATTTDASTTTAVSTTAGEPTTTRDAAADDITTGPTPTAPASDASSGGSVPGPGLVGALTAVLAAAVVALRRT